MGFADFLAQMGSDDGDDHSDRATNVPRISKIGQVARLREFAKLYSEPCPYKVGDLVTPLAGGNLKDAGQPHLVVDKLLEPRWHFDGASGSSSFGRRLNIRVAMISDKGPVCFWAEHFSYEPYTGDGSRPGDLSA